MVINLKKGQLSQNKNKNKVTKKFESIFKENQIFQNNITNLVPNFQRAISLNNNQIYLNALNLIRIEIGKIIFVQIMQQNWNLLMQMHQFNYQNLNNNNYL